MPDMACQAFVTHDEVLAASCACNFTSADSALIDDVIDSASDMLYVLSGGRIYGRCTRTVRPVRRASAYPADTRSWASWELAESVDSIPLRGPNTTVSAVKVDGATLTVGDDYYVLNGRFLVRRDGCWPQFNDLDLADTEPGTFSVTYTFGRTPDYVTKSACIDLVCQMLNDDSRTLSRLRGIVSANVQGVSVQLDEDEVRGLGLTQVNRFMDMYAPRGVAVLGVYSPELDHGWSLHQVAYT